MSCAMLKTTDAGNPQRNNRKPYKRRLSAGNTQSGTSRRRSLNNQPEKTLAEQREAEQRSLNEAIDQRLAPKFESKIYQPGSPEFEALAQMYAAKR